MKKQFDQSVKQSFLAKECVLPGITVTGPSDFGRDITIRSKTKTYDTYFNEKFGNTIIEALDDEIIKIYKEQSKGSELKYKFFNVASSSRLAVASFTQYRNGKISYITNYNGQQIKEIRFEKDLRIKGVSGTAPQMDVWIKTNIEHFVEVKCHEIFDESQHADFLLSFQYRKFVPFMEIINHYQINLLDRQVTITKNGKEQVEFLLNRMFFNIPSKTAHFDLKQFICHLLGIVSNTKENEEKEFIYLFYRSSDPKFEYIYKELEEELSLIKESFGWFFKKYNIRFSYIYNSSFSTLWNFE